MSVWRTAIQAEVSRADELSAALRLELEGIEKQACHSKLAESDMNLYHSLSHPYEQNKARGTAVVISPGRLLLRPVDRVEDLTEIDKIVTNPAVVYLFDLQPKGKSAWREVELLMKSG